MIGLTQLAVRKRAVTIAVVLLVIVAGIWSAKNLGMELLPNVEVPLATVLVVYPGADPQSVLDEVSKPVEEAISGVRGLRSLHTTAEAGVSVTVAEFEYGTNMKDTLAIINQSLAGLRLPPAAQQPKVSDFDFNAFPILRLSLVGEVGIVHLGDLSETVVKPGLEAIDGVRSVEIVGKADKQIHVLLDAEKMAEDRVDVSQISAILQASNVLLPSGEIVEDSRDVTVRSGYRITSTEQIEELALRPAGMPQLAQSSGMAPPGTGEGTSPSRTGPPAAPSAPSFGSPGPAIGSAQAATYRVSQGDTLWDIANREYGNGAMSAAIFAANRDRMVSPDSLQPGLELRLPAPGESQALPFQSAATAPLPPVQQQEALRIRDIATVRLADADGAAIARTNGQPSLGLLVYRNPGSNTVKVAAAIKQAIEEMGAELGQARIITVEDQSVPVKDSIEDMTREATFGAIFAVVVMYLFLFSVRTTLVAAASIPLSLLITFILLNATGMSLNLMTLGGMAVAVGRVVDDTVVVLENVFRHTQRGEGIYKSVRDGVGEVAGAVTSSTLTTVGVFLPLAFVGGIVGEIFRPFALTSTYALLASLLVALTAIPVIATFLFGRPSIPKPRDTLLQRLYTPVIRWALRRKLVSVFIALLVLAGSLAFLPFIGTTFLPESKEKLLQVRVELPAGTGTETTIRIAQEVESVIGLMPGVEVYQTSIGNTGSLLSLTGFGAGNSSTADIFVRLGESSDVEQTATVIREALKSLPSSATIAVSSLDARGTGSSRVEIVVSGIDYGVAKGAAADVMERLKMLDGLANLTSDASTAKPEVSVMVDPEKAIQHGITAAQVALKVREMIVGQVATRVTLGEQPVDVVVRVRPEDANSVEKLRKLAVGTVDAVPLSEIADVQLVEGPVRLTRRNQKASVTISGSITTADTGAVNEAVRAAIDSMKLTPGVSIQFGGVIEQQTEGFSSLGLALIAAIVLVYLIMMATMGSLLDPLVILVSLPLAAIGALLSLLATGRTLGMAALIGMLMLIGIVVTNAIVLLDLVRQLRRQGIETDEALVEAGRTRIRPILMTAATTILALVPLALGFSEGSIIATEMATVVIGGLLTSTMLTLVIVPVVYSLVGGIGGSGRETLGEDDAGD